VVSLRRKRPCRSLTSCLALLTITTTSIQAAERIAIEVHETAGIRRFSFPASFAFNLSEPPSKGTNFRLLDEGKPIEAQFRADGTQHDRSRWWLDFHTSLLPHHSKKFTLEYGTDVPAGPERELGHKLTSIDDAYQVQYGPYISWTIRRDLGGLLKSVNYGQTEHVSPDSTGLSLLDRNGETHPLDGTHESQVVARVVRDGPLAVALRFEVAHANPELRGVRSVVDLHLPVSRSWVEVDWKMIDPEGRTGGMRAELDLPLDAPTSSAPTLVDFGATTMVYAALHPGQQAALRGAVATSAQNSPSESGYAWKILRGPAGHLEPFVFSKRESERNAEGWAHVMDRKSCLAMAIGEFARRSRDRITISAEGSVQLQRSFDTDDAPAQHSQERRFRFWLHFVNFPPQHGAGTSPQAMQNPLDVRVLGGQ